MLTFLITLSSSQPYLEMHLLYEAFIAQSCLCIPVLPLHNSIFWKHNIYIYIYIYMLGFILRLNSNCSPKHHYQLIFPTPIWCFHEGRNRNCVEYYFHMTFLLASREA
jgi:hypothetical protein